MSALSYGQPADKTLLVSPFNFLDVKHLWRRACALIIDGFILTIASISIFLATVHRSFSGVVTIHGHVYQVLSVTEQTRLIAFLAVSAGALGYFVALEWTMGWTIGKFLFGLRVVDFSGDHINLGQAFGRNLCRLLDGMFGYLIGWMIARKSERRQRMGDAVAGTLVVTRSAMDRVHRPVGSQEVRPSFLASREIG